jgi:hypothetical protein
MASALGAAMLVAGTMALAPRAQAEGSDGMGTEAVVEALRAETIRRDSPMGWSNGVATLTPRGDGKYSLSYSGSPQGGVGMRGTAVIIGNADGNPVIEYNLAPTATAMTRR